VSPDCSPNTQPCKFTISKMDAGDLSTVAELERTHQREPWSESAFREELSKLHSLCFVAKVCGDSIDLRDGKSQASQTRVAGYICAWLVLDEIQILNVTVGRPYWRLGIGRALLMHVLRCGWNRGCVRAVLEVRPSNLAAIKLYQSVGFRVVGERPGFYLEDKEAALLMELESEE
jgi:[ribosomal protein S18]-alanine N-acetyltransferase